jgi:TRAP-type uncharacterized transport system fused permease subunit
MFVFYFAVASAITPPVAIAAFAAASISNTEPMRTGFSAVRVGIVMFAIPFIFAWYPELLLIEEAVTITNDAGQSVLIDGYTGVTDWSWMAFLGARLVLALYLLASALSRYDRGPIGGVEMGARLVIAVLILWKTAMVMWVGIGLAVAVICAHYVYAARR